MNQETAIKFFRNLADRLESDELLVSTIDCTSDIQSSVREGESWIINEVRGYSINVRVRKKSSEL